ncbi:MAG: hypothetical protein H6581_02475 [Bacteroidia bacterium]|nr:hypothetical protein [Bacteroidia bacterium]
MKNSLFFLILTLALLLIPRPGNSQINIQMGGSRLKLLENVKADFEAEVLRVTLNTLCEGVAELNLYDGSGKVVWKKIELIGLGESQFFLKRAAFRSGTSYRLQINFKMDLAMLSIAAPPKIRERNPS